MRPVRVDITGVTDASGNFSQVIRLDKTGEWRNLKVAIGTTGPAEWALLTASTPLTYGRGRRVTLGPELLQPFDTLAISCSGGPPSAAVQGSAVGVAGSESEILPNYAPAPNTIALDTTAPLQILRQSTDTNPLGGIYTVQPNTVLSNVVFPIPVGVQSVRYEINQVAVVATWVNNKIVGNVTGKQYNAVTNDSGIAGGADEVWELDPEDTSLLWSIDTTGSANPVKYWLTGHTGTNFVFTKIVQNSDGNPVFVRNDNTPAKWQSPQSKLVNSTATAPATYANILPAVGATKNLYLFWARFDLDAVSGGVFAVSVDGLTANVFVINDNAKGPYVLGPFSGGEPQGVNAGLWVFTTAGVTVRYHVSYTAA